MTARDQSRLFLAPADERTLSDLERAVMDAIDRRGSVTLMQAGRISYRMRGWETLIAVRRAWVASAGRRVLERLVRRDLVEAAGRGRWKRSSDLRGPERSEGPCLSTLTTRGKEANPDTTATTPANRRFFANPPAAEQSLGAGPVSRIRKATGCIGRHRAVARASGPRLRDAQRGDDGRVRA